MALPICRGVQGYRCPFSPRPTDFVFDGESCHPYTVNAPTAPLGEYGRSKLAGELAVLQLLPDALVMRSGWVYSRFGANFVKTMLRLMTERDELGWSPTS